MPRIVACPTCQRTIEWSDAFPYRPFCSERCRLIDLGAWLSEEHSIPGDPAGEREGPEREPPAQGGTDSSER